MPEADVLRDAIQNFKSGQRHKAKDLLTRLLRTEQSNVDYWLWMSAVVETEKEQIFCLQKALKADPNSIAARRGLVLLGAIKPEDAALPPAPGLEGLKVAPAKLRRERSAATPVGPWVLYGLGAVVVIGILFGLVFTVSQLIPKPKPTAVVARPPTATPAPTNSPAPCVLPALLDKATPLAAYLCLTQTPTPMPIVAEELSYAAYQALQRGYFAEDWKKVIDFADDALKVDAVAAKPRPYFYLAEAYRHTDDRNKALQNYNLALAKDRTFAPAYWGRALLNPAQALDDLSAAIKADPTFVMAYLTRGQLYSENGNYSRALADLEQASSLAPGNALVWANLALADVDTQQPDKGLNAAGQALTIDPGLALAYYARGRAEYALGDFEKADADLTLSYQYVLALDALYPSLFQASVYYNFGLAKVAIGEDDAALTAFVQGIQLYDRYPLTAQRLARGQLYLRRADYKSANADFVAAIDQYKATQDPRLIDAYLGNGLAWLGLERPESALSNFVMVVRADPNHLEGNLGLGQSLVQTGKPKDAFDPLNLALTLAQTDAQRARAYFWRAQAYQALKQPLDEAADLVALRALTSADSPLVATAAARLTEIGPLPTVTASPTITPTATLTPTLTLTPDPKATKTPTLTATSKVPATPTLPANSTAYPVALTPTATRRP